MKRTKTRNQQPRRKSIRNGGRLVRGASPLGIGRTVVDTIPVSAVPAACLTVDLEFPIEVDGRELSTLTLRHPTPSDALWYRRQRGSGTDRGLAIIARLCGVPTEALLDLDHIDAAELLERCNELIEGV